MKKIRICFASVILAVCTAVCPVNASALTLVFQGVAVDMAGKDVTVGVYDKDPLAEDFTLENIKYIDQSEIAADGSFRMRIPLSEVLKSPEGLTIRSNIQGTTASEVQPIYCSDNGVALSVGTKEDPCSFKTALDIAADGDTIVLLDKITVPADFVWPQSDKTIRIEGYENKGKLDLTTIEAFSIGCNATFDNLEFLVHDGTDTTATTQTLIYAQGNHVIMGEGVTTDHFVKAIFGGAEGKALPHTNLEIYGGDYKGIYGGGGAKGDISGNSSVIVGGKTNSNTILTPNNSNGKFEGLKGTGGTVLAGGNGSNVLGTAFVTIKDNAVVQYVRGGGTGETNLTVGKCRINIEGGTIMNVFAAVGRSSRESEYICDSEVRMTGGEAEAVFAGADRKDIYGKLTCYLLGGTVTRRAYAGCYNEWKWDWKSDCAVHGTATLVFGPELGSKTLTDTQIGNGIFGGSRRSANSSDETGRLVFLDGCYDRFKANIGKNDMCKSHHDYLLAEGINGSAMFSDLTDEAPSDASAAQITITPDSGYDALLNGEIITDRYYTLQNSAAVEVSFRSNGSGEHETEITSITGAYGTVGSDEVNVNYYTAEKGKLIVAVYDAEDRLVGAAAEDVNPASAMQEAVLPVDCTLNSEYKVQVMLWDGMEDIIPLCPPFPVSVNAQ